MRAASEAVNGPAGALDVIGSEVVDTRNPLLPSGSGHNLRTGGSKWRKLLVPLDRGRWVREVGTFVGGLTGPDCRVFGVQGSTVDCRVVRLL